MRAPSAGLDPERRSYCSPNNSQPPQRPPRNTHVVDEVARLLWRAHAETNIDDAEAARVRGGAYRPVGRLFGQGRGLPPTRPALGLPRASRRPPRSPDRQASLERRRRQAMSGIVPAKIASAFTMGELAVLTVVGRQCQRHGTCSLHVAAIAALAGCERTTVKRALRQARLLGLILVKERRIPGRKSLTNMITIISKEWLGWLKLGIGGQLRPTTDSQAFNSALSRPSPRTQEHSRKEAQRPRHHTRPAVS